jgi:radial spoke head protein 9
MSFASLEDLSYFTLAGFTLNIEERSVLTSSMSAKKAEEKLSNIFLFGKILGIQRDYLIAQSTGENAFERKYFYSLDMINWFQLPEVSPVEIVKIDQIQARFMGDPTFDYTVTKNADGTDFPPNVFLFLNLCRKELSRKTKD